MEPHDRDFRWGRLSVDLRTALRRGAWYRVLSAGPEEAVLEVRGVPTILPREALEIVARVPRVWSVVHQEWGGPYLVCPICASRIRTTQIDGVVVCPDCSAALPVESEAPAAPKREVR